MQPIANDKNILIRRGKLYILFAHKMARNSMNHIDYVPYAVQVLLYQSQ